MYSVCTLLKVVGYYDLSVLSMSVMGLKKKNWPGGEMSSLSVDIYSYTTVLYISTN